MIAAGRAGLAALLLAAAGCGAAAPDLVLVDVAVVDVEAGRVLPGRTIEIAGGEIVAVRETAGGPVPAAARVERLTGHYLMPGLWDMHVHALWDDQVADDFLPAFTRAGVTGIRDMGGSLEVLARVRAEPDPGWPRVVAAGRVLDGPRPVDPSVSEAAGSAMEARAALQRIRLGGGDFLKVYTLLPREAFLAAAQLAAYREMQVAGHVPGELTPLEAAEAGLASIEHLRDELGGLCADLPAEECAVLPERLAALGTHVTPTMVILEAKAIPGYVGSRPVPELESLPPALAQYWREASEAQRGRGEERFRRRREILAGHREMLPRLAAAGVPFLMGTDAGSPWVLPGESLHRELAQYEGVLTPREVLYAATLGAARFLGLEDSGRIAAGQAADLVVLEADPLESLANARRIAAVVRAGRWIEPPEEM